MAAMIEVSCKNCSSLVMKRKADVKRGWGLFCNKSCKAIAQEKKTGQYARYKNQREEDDEERLMFPSFSEDGVQ